MLLPCIALALAFVSEGTADGGGPLGRRTGPARIGMLTDSWGPTPSMVGLRDGLVERGYREGQHFEIGVRFTQGDIAALPAAAAALVEYGVDVIFAMGANAAKAAQAATPRIPIVFAGAVGDPVGLGLVQSFARPGTNITGVTDLDLDLAPKRLEILREMVPRLKRVLFAYDPADPYAVATARGYAEAARRLGVMLVEKRVRSDEEAAALATLQKGEVDGILGVSSLSMNINGFILEAATRHGIPNMFNDVFWVERMEALASYGPDLRESGRLAARLVEKILKGANPASVPVEENPKIELAINTTVARKMGLTIAPAMLLRAHRLVQ